MPWWQNTNNYNNNHTYKPPKESVFKGTIIDMNGHTFQCHGEASHASQFTRTCEELQRYCLKNYKYGDDVAFIVRHYKEYNMAKHKPKAAPKTADAIDIRIVEKQVDQYVHRITIYHQNKKALYMIIWAQCSSAMQARMKSAINFDNFDEDRDCLTLLKEIKGVSYKFEAQRYPPLALYEAKATFFRYVQHRSLSNTDYLDKFKALYEIIEHYGGNIGDDPMLVRDEARRQNVLHHATLNKGDTEYIVNIPLARNRFLAYAFLQGADKSRFGDLLLELENQHTCGSDRFPSDITNAYNLLVNYKSKSHKRQYDDDKKGDNFTFMVDSDGKYVNEKGEKVNSKGDPLKCFKCGGKHYSNDPNCPKNKDKLEEITAYPLSSTSAITPTKNPTDVDFVMTLTDFDDENEGLNRTLQVTLDDDDNIPHYGDMCFSMIPTILKNSSWLHPNYIILDTGSTVTLIKNHKLLRDIYCVPIDERLQVYCNSGKQNSTYRGIFPGLGDVWYNEQSLANIISFSQLSDLFRIEFDQQTDSFIVHTDDNSTIQFVRKGGLFVYDATDHLKQDNNDFLFLQTVSDNKLNFTENDIERADRARRLYITLGRPSLRAFRWMLLHNKIKNTDITAKDSDNAETIYGPDIGTLRGKTVRRKPKRVHFPTQLNLNINDDNLAALQQTILSADIFYVDQLKFVVTLSRQLHFATVEFIPNRKLDTIFEALSNSISLYKYFDFKVRTLLSDSEFVGLKNKLLHLGVLLNPASAYEHMGEIERFIQVIKERVRAIITTLPFQFMPRILRREIIYFAVSALNHTIRPNGIIKNTSPTNIVTGQVLDADYNCCLPIASFCHVPYYDNPRNDTEKARTVDAIALRPTGNIQGGYYFLRLDTWSRITRHNWIELPMPDDIITLINEKGASQTSADDKFIFRSNDKSFITSLAVQETQLLQDFYAAEGANELPNTTILDDILEHQNDEVLNSESDNNDIDDDNTISDNSMDDEPATTLVDTPDDNTPNDIPITPIDIIPENIEDDLESQSDTSLAEARSDTASSATANNESTDSLEVAIKNIDSSINESNIIPGNNRNKYNLRRNTSTSYNEKDMRLNEFTLHIDTYDQLHPKPPSKTHWDYNNRFEFAFTQMSAKEGLRRFGEKAAEALIKEWQQLDEKKVFHGIHFKDTTSEQRKGALRLVQLIKQKRCGKIKGRTCADGRKQRQYINQEDSTSPTVSTEALLITLMIDAHEHRDVATTDVPGAFLHSDMDEDVTVVVDGALVDLLVQSNNKYAEFVHICKNGKKVVFMKLDKALYGTVRAARLFWENLSGKLRDYGFETNPYDPCVMNKIINDKQCTIVWHVDDLKISHVDSKVVDEMLAYLSSQFEELSTTRGNKHTYVGMDIYFPGDGTVDIDMSHYLQEALDAFPELIDKLVTSPAANHIFEVNEDSPKLSEEKREKLHSIVAKLLFVSTRGRPDIHLPISFLTSRVTKADDDDWKKLKRLLQYIKGTMDLRLTLSAEKMNIVKWWVDAAYAVRQGCRSQTGSTMTLGRGTIMSKSTKQKINTKSSTESELVGASDSVPQIVWTNYFIAAQGYEINDTILYQDNTSAIAMETNGKLSSGKRTKHINIRYFFIQDRVRNGEITLKYCPTDQMLADYFTKPLQGIKFIQFRDMILGITPIVFTE